MLLLKIRKYVLFLNLFSWLSLLIGELRPSVFKFVSERFVLVAVVFSVCVLSLPLPPL